MGIKERLKKLAQATDPNASTETGPTSVSGNPSPFSAIGLYPSIAQGWGAPNIAPIQKFLDDLNQGLYVMSNQELDLNKLRSASFNIDPSKYKDSVIAKLVSLSLIVYRQILTNGGKNFTTPIVPQNKANGINHISQIINNADMASDNNNAGLSSRIGGNLKEQLLSNLSQIK